MKSHELAKKLLALPNIKVAIPINKFGENSSDVRMVKSCKKFQSLIESDLKEIIVIDY